jgi:hypothetical protein
MGVTATIPTKTREKIGNFVHEKMDTTGIIDIHLICPNQNSLPFLSIRVLPADPDAECIVSLAVCDMTRKGTLWISNVDCPVKIQV